MSTVGRQASAALESRLDRLGFRRRGLPPYSGNAGGQCE
jgi:hypothetical protein